MRKMQLSLIFILFAGLLLSACQPFPPADMPPVEEPPAEDEYTYGQDAVVENLEVMLLESFPLQANVIIAGYLPDGCTELVEINVERQGMEFVINLTTRRPTGNVACTMALEPFEKLVDLPIDGLEAGTYTVVAQDHQAQFILDVENALPNEPVVGGFDKLIGSAGVVESMSLSVMESFPVQVRVELSGYLPDGCTTLREITAARDGDTFTIQVVTERPSGDVACTMAIVPFSESVPLEVAGLPAGEYTVRVGELTEIFTLEVDN